MLVSIFMNVQTAMLSWNHNQVIAVFFLVMELKNVHQFKSPKNVIVVGNKNRIPKHFEAAFISRPVHPGFFVHFSDFARLETFQTLQFLQTSYYFDR